MSRAFALGLGFAAVASVSCLLTVSTSGLTGGVAAPGADAAPEAAAPSVAAEGGADAGGAAGGSSYAAVVVADDPFAYWRFEETAGSVAHDERKGHDAAYVPETVSHTAGIAGSLGVDLRSSLKTRVETDSPAFRFADGHAFAIEVWLSLRSVDEGARIAGTESVGQSTGWFFTVSDGAPGPYFSFRAANGAFIEELEGTQRLVTGRFQHIVLTFDGSRAELWVDGQPDSADGWTGTPAAVGVLTWGCRLQNGAPGNCVDGVLDEAAIYAHGLAADRIRAHYAAGKP